MDNLNMTTGYPYSNPLWSTAGADITLTAPATDGIDNWNEFMQWGEPSQNTDIKPPNNDQGPLLTQDPKSSLIERRQSSNMPGTSLSLQPEAVALSAPFQPQINPTPYTFGGDIQNPPAFDFNHNTISPPSSGGGQQQGGVFPSPIWPQQDKQQNTVLSTSEFAPTHVVPVQLPPASTPSLQHSPTSQANARTSSSSTSPSAATSPESIPSNPKKRKSTSEESEVPAAKKESKQPPKKTAHNMIEKRYRTNLNDKIAALRDSVPSLRVMSRQNGGNEEDDDPEDLEGLTPAHKLNKATVLSKATEYIRHLEKRNKRLMEEINTLKSRLDSYERMATTGFLPLGGAGPTADGRYHEDSFASHVPPMMQQPVTAPPQGLIPVPHDMASLHRGHPAQAHYAPQHGSYAQYTGVNRPGAPGPPVVNGQRGSSMISKLMVGSLATLMLVEGFSEPEQSGDEPAGRGLFSLPIHLAGILAPRISIGGASAQIPLAKVLLLFGALFYFLAPLFEPKPKSKKKAVPEVQLARAPSLASSVEVRRSAWLTAIQTVWVPKHNFWLEVAALSLKTLKLSLRTIIGWPGYAFLMGTTKDQEAARVKAWNIALDAQLTGGDEEISKSRLVLTLMASGTLPNTPARLMLKALHIRLLLWELTNTCNGGWRFLDDLSAKVARSYWNAARSEQRIAANMASKPDSEAEPLPDHLAALLEIECDAVLMPHIIQRAYNLAWNRPSAEKTTADESMDTVVEDFAICTPLDALAAWWSCHVLRRALAAFLASKNGAANAAVKRNLNLASQTAPPTSQAHLRALVAQSVLEEEDRSTRVATAFGALPSSLSSPHSRKPSKPAPPVPLNVVAETPVATDVQNALTLTKCLSLVESGNPDARRRAVLVINNILLPESSMSLLSFVAGYRLLKHCMQDSELRKDAAFGLERLLSSLRIWIGREPARRSGLSNKVRRRIVSQCLNASKTLVGLTMPEQVDDGYVSAC
ncbi:uncharacterized protein EI97DRAFT_219233 [Westerdykella ornata]|uniref:BHLH domain-containing protein n=1 Tax=Westerdykella ornata TaxID=318751 RepID=A0A6A6JSR9_WESOR|nr:uncharacterized protein EI97DRAFT_219233 [Westerdykella ornata]KAF2278786.1 hypothetical protein EI97DRAFT_219233 [Westerdykella ornata]